MFDKAASGGTSGSPGSAPPAGGGSAPAAAGVPGPAMSAGGVK
jgi:hypothetical protein